MRRWALRIVAALIVVAVVAVGVLVARVPRDDVSVVAAGDLVLESEVRDTELNLDSLSLRIHEDQRLELTENGEPLWVSLPGSGFLTASRGALQVPEHRGYFWPRTTHDAELDEQTLHSSRVEEDRIVLAGELGHSSERTDAVGWEATIRQRPEGGAILEVTMTEPVDTVGLVTGARSGQGVYGLGAQYAPADLGGRRIPVIVREQGVGRGAQPLTFLADVTNNGAGGTESMTYAAWSSFVFEGDTRFHGVRLDPALAESHAFAVLDATAESHTTLEVWADRLRAELTAADTPLELIETQQAGRSRPGLAEWTSSGAIVGLQGGTAEVRQQVEALTAAGAEISAVWLQDWVGRRTTDFGDRLWWTWQLDEVHYPDWDELVSDLAAQGIRTTTYVNAFLVDASAKGDAGIRNLWAEARDAGYLVEDDSGEAYLLDQGGFDASLVDLTNPAARQWFSAVIAEEVLRDGVDGFMADFAEGLPFDAVLADGDPIVEHNRWPLLWAQTVRDACELAGKPDCVTWFRTGSLGMDEFTPMFWAGDQMVDFSDEDGMRSALRGMLAGGVSGWPLVHSDVGGYTSINAVVRDYVRSPELLARWAELEAFGVLMRTHEGNRPAANVQVSSTAETRGQFARMTRLYASLADYRRAVVEEALSSGVPALRPMWVMAPGTAASTAEDQFFFGDSVLVAPVLDEGADSVEVSLPPGSWEHLLTGEVLAGDRAHTVAAPLGEPAAFVRTDDPWAQRLNQAVQAGVSND